MSLITALPASATIRFTLPDGLSWGSDLPDSTESCTSTPSTGECQTQTLEPIAGRNAVGWGWDVVAARTGSYVLRAAIVSASEPDPEPSNDTASVTVVVTEAAPPPPPPPTTSTTASAARVTPAKPKAGAQVVATVRVTAGGAAVRPTGVKCTGALAGAALRGAPRATAGAATCTYRPARSAKGKTLRGSVSFAARGQTFTKRFSARLG